MSRGHSDPRHRSVDKFPATRHVCPMTFDEDLDAIGLICPLPVLKLRKRLQTVAAGAVLRIRADDPAAAIDIPHYCAEAGHEFLGGAEEDGVGHYLVRKAT